MICSLGEECGLWSDSDLPGSPLPSGPISGDAPSVAPRGPAYYVQTLILSN